MKNEKILIELKCPKCGTEKSVENNSHAIQCEHCRDVFYINEMQVGETYKVAFRDNGWGVHIYFDTVTCLAVLAKTYRVKSNRCDERIYLLRKENIFEIEKDTNK